MAANNPKASKGLGGLIIPFAIAGIFLLGYYAYWSKAAHEIENQARRVLSESTNSLVKVDGFPYRLSLTISDFKFANQNGLAFSASSLSATASPFNPVLWVLEGALDPKLTLPDQPERALVATNLKASLRLNNTGLERLSLTFDGLEAQGDGGWNMGAGFTHFVSDPKNADTLAFVTDISALRITKPLEGPAAIMGETINHIRIAGPISQASAFKRSLRAWQENDGKLTIMAGEVVWGPISLTNATGELALSTTGKWNGQLSGQGALNPEGKALQGLSAPVNLEIKEGKLGLSGLTGFILPNAFQ
jgi:hypothetical protein